MFPIYTTTIYVFSTPIGGNNIIVLTMKVILLFNIFQKILTIKPQARLNLFNPLISNLRLPHSFHFPLFKLKFSSSPNTAIFEEVDPSLYEGRGDFTLYRFTNHNSLKDLTEKLGYQWNTNHQP